ncbi:bifunctional pantoate--beta-alanine ligase/(d)CMP kinase [Microcoleus sp. FACHB-672]|uniref:bifunctional pantoate--beta-alanine ligase/(d)CMP kinase n=1 Tax=Microcoleus sp. FACHB-672 TaxID=2692825 RepID=UPI0016845665|nr:bifunctional pantoate--beta-alanine ligase/(d)CMP kinase [Microcoleus sp. FACHB-672]MBD2041352.1 bifunctional pantoate--beta-alanine ligase/(d)CMP kinase [Microcoleus sp. FACHB-672]
MRLFTTVAALRCYLGLHRPEQHLGQEVGFVPTMGALHQGHLSLIQRARQENEIVIVSIFVNPLQFGPTEDFQKYPRTLEQDRQLCEAAGVDVLFAPTVEEIGVRGRESGRSGDLAQNLPSHLLTEVIPPASMTSVMCGRSRIGHFQGVTTIVTKLLNLVQPNRAYFGQKDAQQVAIIKRLVADLNLPVEIVPCPIVRETSGLAMSSRNKYLNSEDKEQATVLYRSLQKAEKAFIAGERTGTVMMASVKAELAKVPSVQLEYVELVDPTTLMPLDKVEEVGLLAVAARLGSTRLIDNIVLRDRQPIVAIDGPAGAGKSTVASLVAQALGLLYLDTGAMYRAVTWLVLQAGIPINDEPAVAELVADSEISFAGLATNDWQASRETDASQSSMPNAQILINGEDVTGFIRSLEVTANVSAISAQPAVRQLLVKQQQNFGNKGGLVAEGRDIGTQVFPDAELKIFLTASVQERARRRHQDIEQQGDNIISLQQLEHDISERDRKDTNRAVSPLRKAADAIEIQTDGLSIAEVVERIVRCYYNRLPASV